MHRPGSGAADQAHASATDDLADAETLHAVLLEAVSQDLRDPLAAVRRSAAELAAGHGPAGAAANRLGVVGRTGGAAGVAPAIAEGFVEAMNGELTVDEASGGGTSFVIALGRAA